MNILSQALPVVDAEIFRAESYTFFRANKKRFPLRPGGEILFFHCPWCRRIHMHGSPGARFVGKIVTRGSHCQAAIDNGVGEYALYICGMVKQ
jgi:hypothetical protein